MISGSCHCGNLGYELETRVPPQDIVARACDCSFCRRHGARCWSDPAGAVNILVRERSLLGMYRFGLGTADFLFCLRCGSYLGALLSDGDRHWATVNLRLTPLAGAPERPASYGGEQAADRIARRKNAWTPARITYGTA